MRTHIANMVADIITDVMAERRMNFTLLALIKIYCNLTITIAATITKTQFVECISVRIWSIKFFNDSTA